MVRRAKLDDGRAIAELARQLGYPGGGALLGDILSRDDHAIFVSIDSGRAIGCIHVCEVLSIESDAFGEIRALVVDEDHRGRGVGEELVRAAEEWTRLRNLAKLRVRSNVVRDAARRFYERLGYGVTKTQNVFDKKLPAGDG